MTTMTTMMMMKAMHLTTAHLYEITIKQYYFENVTVFHEVYFQQNMSVYTHHSFIRHALLVNWLDIHPISLQNCFNTSCNRFIDVPEGIF